jgi:hypothetical protein
MTITEMIGKREFSIATASDGRGIRLSPAAERHLKSEPKIREEASGLFRLKAEWYTMRI